MRVAIGDDFGRYAESGKDVIEVKLCHSFGVDGFVTGEEYGHFGTPLVGDGEDGIVSL